MHRYLLGILCGVFVVPAFGEPELQGVPSELTQYLLNDKKVMAIHAEGEVRVQADKAIVTLRVKNKDGNFGVALQANRALRDMLKQRLVDARIPADNITFAKYASVPSYGLFGDKPSSYEISNEVTVAVRGEEEFVAVAQAVDAMKEVAYLGIEFQDTQKKMNEAQALDNAMQNVRAKQALYEKNLGIALGVLRVLDSPVVFARPLMPRMMSRAKSAMDSVESMLQSAPTEVAGEPGAEGGAFGTLVYRASVGVEYLVK